MEDIDDLFAMSQIEMESTIDFLKHELVKIRTGKASTAVLGGIVVEYYGTPTPLGQVANLATQDSKTLTIQPWEKTMLGPIEKAIFEANLGLTPMNDGEMIRISVPPLTEERRKEMVKRAKSTGEDAKVSLRNVRQKMMTSIKNAVKNGLPEDTGKRKEDEVQKMINKFGDQVNEIVAAKEKDIMTV